MLASMIFRKEPFFHGHDNYDQVCMFVGLLFSVLLIFPSVAVRPSGCWSTGPRPVVLTLMREHCNCVYLYMLCRLMY